MQQNQQLAELAIKVAKFFNGQKEATGNNDGYFVNFCQFYVGGKADIGSPWCDEFASLCTAIAANLMGIATVLKSSDSSTGTYAQAVAAGLVLAAPIVGCLGLIKAQPGSGKTHEHTYRVLAVNSDGTVSSIDGNWGNCVCETTHPISGSDFVALA